MRKNILVLIILLFTFIAHGQTYKALLLDGNRWNNFYIPHPSGIKCGKISMVDSTGTEILTFSADTTQLNGKIYRKLISSSSIALDSGFGIGLIREDTVSEKTYFLGNEGFFPFELMIYDFSVKAKDTVWFYNQNYYNFYNLVDTVDSINIGNEFRKRVKLDNGKIWIEGIGALDGLVSSAMELPLCGTYYTRNLLCFYNKDSLIYKPANPGYDNCYYSTVYVGIRPREEMINFTISPNPAGDFLIINSECSANYNVEIADIQGRVLIKTESNSEQYRISLSDLNKGIFFIRIRDRNKIFTCKIVKK